MNILKDKTIVILFNNNSKEIEGISDIGKIIEWIGMLPDDGFVPGFAIIV